MNHMCSPVFGEYFNGMKPCILDIEATGLDPSRCKVILMGLLTETDFGVKVTQFLAENHYEEHKVLQATMEFLKDEGIDYIVTFNGLRYDVPFINTRLEANFMIDTCDGDSDRLARLNLYDFDLYRFLRKCSNLPDKLESLSQASCEKYFGISGDRQDTISGRESVALFDEYAVSGNSTIEKIILTHNREDVLQLYKLMKLVSANEYSDILDCDFHAAIAKYGFPIDGGRFTARPSINAKKKMLHITGDQNYDAFAAAYFPDIDRPFTAIFNASTSSFEIDIPISTRGNDCYIDLTIYNLEESFSNDPNCVNNYLIFNPRTINRLVNYTLNRK